MHSSRMRTARSLTISHSICHACPPCHTCLPTPPATHAPHHAHPLPCMPLPYTPPARYAPNAMHTPLPCTPPTMHTPPPHMPPPCMPPCHAHPPPWTETLTHATQNITLPQTSFAGGKYEYSCLLIAIFRKKEMGRQRCRPKSDKKCKH